MTLAKRHITARLSPFAATERGWKDDDRRCGATFWSRYPHQVLTALLGLIGRSPADVAAGEWGGWPALYGQVDPEAFPHDAGRPQPLAFFWDGLTASELEAALTALTPPRAAAAAHPSKGSSI